jgi:hypothetical protein
VNWVDYVNVLLAVWLAAAPWFLEYVLSSVRREDLGAAALLLIIATCGIVLRTREQVVAASALGCGAWIVMAPWVMGYAGRNPVPALNEVWIGFVVMLFAGLRLYAAGTLDRR